MTALKIPLNLFGIAFGMAGLAGSWLTMSEFGHAPQAVGDVLIALAGLTWLVVLVAYLRWALPHRRLVADLLDPIGGPFASLVVIVPMLIAAEGIYPQAHATGRVTFDAFLALTVLLGGWFTGQWIYTPMNLDTFHPGYPPALLPTYAIEVAPAAVASLAWFALNGGHIDSVAALLGGYGLLMVLAQLRLLPPYLRLRFMPSTWAFTFSWAAVATAGLRWLQALGLAGATAWQYLVLALITALIAAIAIRTVIALARGQLLPAPAAPTATLTTPAQSQQTPRPTPKTVPDVPDTVQRLRVGEFARYG